MYLANFQKPDPFHKTHAQIKKLNVAGGPRAPPRASCSSLPCRALSWGHTPLHAWSSYSQPEGHGRVWMRRALPSHRLHTGLWVVSPSTTGLAFCVGHVLRIPKLAPSPPPAHPPPTFPFTPVPSLLSATARPSAESTLQGEGLPQKHFLLQRNTTANHQKISRHFLLKSIKCRHKHSLLPSHRRHACLPPGRTEPQARRGRGRESTARAPLSSPRKSMGGGRRGSLGRRAVSCGAILGGYSLHHASAIRRDPEDLTSKGAQPGRRGSGDEHC